MLGAVVWKRYTGCHVPRLRGHAERGTGDRANMHTVPAVVRVRILSGTYCGRKVCFTVLTHRLSSDSFATMKCAVGPSNRGHLLLK
jgi:hypothetical protein